MMAGITPNTSNQQLVPTANGSDNDSATALLDPHDPRRTGGHSKWSRNITVAILCFINLINYMDRFTLAGVLEDVQDEFKIDNSYAGLLQTVFVASYMVFAPLFGYLGDRYSRRWILAAGITLWCLTTFVGSFLANFYVFMLFRGLVGIGEASYSTIAPTIISDLFVGNARSKALALFYFAIPVGSGLGYIVGSSTADLAKSWRWGLRVTPLLGPIAVLLVIFLMVEPKRGHAEKSKISHTSYWEDIKSLLRNPSFMLSTMAFTCVAFVTGALAWWAPQFIYLGIKLIPGSTTSLSDVAYKFGLISMLAGALGVPAGSQLSRWLRTRSFRRNTRPTESEENLDSDLAPEPQGIGVKADPMLCAVALLGSCPLLFAAMTIASIQPRATLAIVFFAQLIINLTWAIVADICLYVVVPPRRSTAEAFQILISHMFGDAGSPYLVGVISEALKARMTPAGGIPSPSTEFHSLQYALYTTCFVEVIGGALFLITAFFIVRDKERVDKAIADAELRSTEPKHTEANSLTAA